MAVYTALQFPAYHMAFIPKPAQVVCWCCIRGASIVGSAVDLKECKCHEQVCRGQGGVWPSETLHNKTRSKKEASSTKCEIKSGCELTPHEGSKPTVT